MQSGYLLDIKDIIRNKVQHYYIPTLNILECCEYVRINLFSVYIKNAIFVNSCYIAFLKNWKLSDRQTLKQCAKKSSCCVKMRSKQLYMMSKQRQGIYADVNRVMCEKIYRVIHVILRIFAKHYKASFTEPIYI